MENLAMKNGKLIQKVILIQINLIKKKNIDI